MQIAIIGAGPVGCYAASLLAKKGHDVSLYEEHAQIGQPIQCTGLITAELEKFTFDHSPFLVNTFSGLEINSPNNRIFLPQKEYLVERSRFDSYLAKLALKAGTKIFLQHSFLRREGKDIIIKDLLQKKEKKLSPDWIIAADGPLSKVACSFGLLPERENYQGIQVTVEGKFEQQKYQTYFGRSVCSDFFAWVVPESATRARVGLAARKGAKAQLENFLKQNQLQPLEWQAGLIPLYHPKQKLQKDNCYLLGDAAGFVKATTLGGLVPGLKQAEILAEVLESGKSYEKALRPLRRELGMHLKLRKIMDRFEDKDWDEVINILNRPKMQKLLQQHNRDNIIPLILKAALLQPRLWKFAKYLF